MKRLKRIMVALMLTIMLTILLAARVVQAATPNSRTWNIVSSPNIGTLGSSLSSVAAVSANNIWTVGDYIHFVNGGDVYQTLIEHWNGTSWSVVSSPNAGGGSNFLFGVAAVSSSDIWAVGTYPTLNQQTLIEHWDGTSWSVVPSPNVASVDNYLYSVVAVSATDIWAVGISVNSSQLGPDQTLIEHWDGTSWSIVPSPNVGTLDNRLNGVAAVSASDIWAVGNYFNSNFYYKTLIEHWDGTSWSVVSSPNPGANNNNLSGVAAISSSDVWAVGGSPRGTLIEQWNGTNWSIVSSPRLGDLFSVAVVSATNIWAVGNYYNTSGINQTLIVHWNGTKWNVSSSPNPATYDNPLQGVAAVSASNVWAVGDYENSNAVYQTLTEFY